MRPILIALPFLLLAGCGRGDDAPAERESLVEPGMFAAAQGRGGVCVEPDNAAFLLADEGPASCMAQGQIVTEGEGLSFVPRGDAQCAIPLTLEGDTLTFGDGGEACAFYCGGGLELAGRSARRTDSLEPLTDIAGEALC